MDIPDISASGILTAITVSFAVIGFIKGIFKLLLTFAILAGAATAGYLTFEGTNDLIHRKWPSIPELTPYIVAAVASIATFLILRTIFRFILNPFDNDNRKGNGFIGFIIGTTLAIGGLWIGINQLIRQGSKQEIHYWLAQDEPNPPQKLPFISTIKQTFARSTLGEKIAAIHPLHDPADHTLAKLAAMRITATGKFTKIANTLEINEQRGTEIYAYFSHPDTVESVDQNNAQALLNSPALPDIIKDENLKSAITRIDIEQTLNLR